MKFIKNIVKILAHILNLFLYIYALAGIIHVLTNPKDIKVWGLTVLFIAIIIINRNIIKKINADLFAEQQAEKLAQEYADNIKIRTVSKSADGKKVQVTLEPLEIYSNKKPEIINFISDEDYKVLLNFYSGHFYGSKTDLNTLLKPYPYDKYNWNVCLQIIWKYQNFIKQIKEYKRLGVKKAELICPDNCECCKNFKNKEILIDEFPELPNKNCPFDTRICLAALCSAVIEF